ncbi:MAG: MgtC/SapB family protein, partial [Brevundimonas sp.]
VIFRSGFSIHGLTTAASLWITAALGLLFGAGLFALGAAGTVLTGAILVMLKLVEMKMPKRSVVDAEVVWRRADPDAEGRIETALEGVDRDRRADRFEMIDGGDAVRRSFRLKLEREAALKDLAARLRTIEGVTAYKLNPRDD